jgi:SWI/SNF-related matrix-associated actin-dependent regulator 1 of chromatin subfamily A
MDGLAAALKLRGEEYIRIDGQTASKDRHSRVQHFQGSSQCRVAILAITAAGIALTLTAASTVYFAELYWTPAALLQAEDRAHRIGQSRVVQVTYFLADDTVDELLWPMVRQKMKLLGKNLLHDLRRNVCILS